MTESENAQNAILWTYKLTPHAPHGQHDQTKGWALYMGVDTTTTHGGRISTVLSFIYDWFTKLPKECN
jgi:hypothetical protein